MAEKYGTSAKAPTGAASSDRSGEKKVSIKGGVGMGKADMTGSQEHGVGREGMGANDGRKGEFKGHKGESVVYDHKRYDHDQDD